MPEENLLEAEPSQSLTKSELQELLGPNFVVESFTSRRLTEVGDNYFSNIQALEVTLLPHHSTLSLIAKLPPASKFLQEMSQFGKLTRKEMRMYLEVAKVFQDIQQENRIPVGQVADFFPKCYGAHISYVDDKPVADNCALLLENLQPLGYRCADRIAGLDFAHTDLVVSRLARFHSTAIAVKTKKPLLFKNIILPACENPRPEGASPDKKVNIKETCVRAIENIEELQPYLDQLKNSISTRTDVPSLSREPFASIKHGDFWTNNFMFKYSSDSPGSFPVDVKFVDFQGTQYDSPARDLIFLLYSSTELGLVVEHYSHFVQLYHEQFIDQLTKLGCDTEPFSYDALKDEIDRAAREELHHCLLMLTVITRRKTDAPDIDEMNSISDMQKIIDSNKSEEYKNRVIQLVSEFSKKGWL